ncbi:MAG: c-type cytochrome biogenesis protein CcsB [Armatimonadetes bacterium]|nr:c-type cytochrome biogenesis protein CcsB [Armatimonadota bacterium]
MEHAAIIIQITLLLYGCAAVFYLWNILGGTNLTKRTATTLTFLGLLSHTAGIIDVGVQLRRAPLINLFESLTFFALALVAIYLIMERRYKITALGAFATLLAVCLLVVASTLPKGVNGALLPALRSHWSTIHIVTCLIGYASFALAFGAALCYVVQERMLKTKRLTVFQKHLPSLDVADHLAYKMVSLGFPMLTLGIVTGALWAQSAWDAYWSWDPKETWSLITWLVYAAYLHVRIVSRWRGRWANRLLIAGFVCVLVTYFGVNFLGRGLHKYNW